MHVCSYTDKISKSEVLLEVVYYSVVNVVFLTAVLSSRRELPFIKTAHLSNPWNEHKPVKIGRDGQVGDTAFSSSFVFFPLSEPTFLTISPPLLCFPQCHSHNALRRSNRTSVLSSVPSFRWTRAWTSTRSPATFDTSVGARQKRGPVVGHRSVNREG